MERQFALSSGRQMVLMTLSPEAFIPPVTMRTVERLGARDLNALLEVYAGYPENAFTADALRDGVFYGVRDGVRIVAAGGTHVVSARHALATVGSIYTRPEARGRGYATAITAAVVSELQSTGSRDINLNVAAGNDSAIRVYQRLGFHEHCHFREAHARLLSGCA